MLDRASSKALALVIAGGTPPAVARAVGDGVSVVDAMLNKKTVASMVGVSPSTLDRMIARGDFEKPRQLSPRRVGWPLSYVQAWISARPCRSS